MAIDIRAEIALLKKLKNRFTSTDAYINTIQDMYEEGLITSKAFREITNWLINSRNNKVSTSASRKKVPTAALKSSNIPKSTTSKNENIDPCSHGGFRHTSC